MKKLNLGPEHLCIANVISGLFYKDFQANEWNLDTFKQTNKIGLSDFVGNTDSVSLGG